MSWIKGKVDAALGKVGWHAWWRNESGEGCFPWNGRARVQSLASGLTFEWLADLRAAAGVSLSFDPLEGDVTLSISTPLGSLWLTAQHPRLYGRSSEARAVRLSVDGAVIRWRLWVDPDTWSSERPRWRDGRIDLAEALLGEEAEMRSLSKVEVRVPLPEGSYPATVELREVTTWRTALPRLTREVHHTGEVRILNGVKPPPIPGKGENSWDCDDDAIYANYGPARGVGEAVAAYVEAVLTARERRRGRVDWMPPAPDGGQASPAVPEESLPPPPDAPSAVARPVRVIPLSVN